MTLPAKPPSPVPPEAKAYRLAPLKDQIKAVEKALERQQSYHRKIMQCGTYLQPSLYAMREWHLTSALRTLEELQAKGKAE